MRTRIRLYGEIAGEIWMPAVRCTTMFELDLIRIPRDSATLEPLEISAEIGSMLVANITLFL